jgi:hypothetical protein
MLRLLLLIALLPLAGSAQLTVRLTVIDATTQAPLSYATVVNLSNGRGSLTNELGEVQLTNLQPEDELKFSFLGYSPVSVSAAKAAGWSQVELSPRVLQLQTANVVGDPSWMYELLLKTRRKRNFKKQTARTYYNLNTRIDGALVEWIEAYYNADIIGEDLHRMHLKNGRVGIREWDRRFFLTLNTAKAILMYQPFSGNRYFPDAPFEMRKRELLKTYELQLEQTYRDSEGNAVVVIGFTPLIAPNQHFSGRAWIDSTTAVLHKIELNVEQSTVSPFVPILPNDSIGPIRLKMTRTYGRHEGENRFQQVEFRYSAKYFSEYLAPVDLESRAVIHAYDYDSAFVIPRAPYLTTGLDDYKRMNAIPHNSVFWSFGADFDLGADKDALERFYQSADVFRNDQLFRDRGSDTLHLYEAPIVFWNPKRVQIRMVHDAETTTNEHWGTMVMPRPYELSADLFMDVNQTPKGLHYKTEAVFDPYKTYWAGEMDRFELAFVNLYFDLFECARRDLLTALQEVHDVTVAQKLFDQFRTQAFQFGEELITSAERGHAEKAMRKWDAYVDERLGISNIATFELEWIDGQPKGLQD